MFDDSQINAPSSQVTNDQQTQAAIPSTAANPPATPASPSTPPASDSQQPPSQSSTQSMVSNPGAIAKRGAQDPGLVTPVDASQHPLVQRAGVTNAIARALAGNPRRVVIDPDGTRREEPVPLTKGQVAMAIAMEALTGSLAGLQAGRGRGAGAAGMAGFETVRRQQLEARQEQERQAQQQFDDRSKALAQQASAYAANLRTRALAQEVGMRDEQSHKDWIASHASTAQYFRDHGGIIRDLMPESELTPEFTKEALQKGWVAIPVAYVPRFDAKGNHYSPDGVPMHDNLYMVVDGRKITLPPDVLQRAQDWELPGVMNYRGEPHNLSDVELRVGTITDMSNKVAVLEQEQKDLKDYYTYLNSKGLKGPDGKPLEAPNLKEMVRKNPGLIHYITGSWANHFAESPSAALHAMKDDLPAKGPISNLYGGKQLLDRYDLLKAADKKTSEAQAQADVEIGKEKRLIPIKAATAGAEERARVAANPQKNDAALTTPDALGFKPNVPGGLKEYNKRFDAFKKNADDLSKMEGTFQQFQAITSDINAGRFTGADSIVGLFDAIGISATPLAGRGFRVNQNVIEEHAHARGWAGALQQKLLNAKAGDIITPQQLKDYANIAAQARRSQYINLVNQVHNSGLNADFVLPTGNGQPIDQGTAQIFLALSGSDPARAMAAAKAKGWVLP